jgi:hypothetical protein
LKETKDDPIDHPRFCLLRRGFIDFQSIQGSIGRIDQSKQITETITWESLEGLTKPNQLPSQRIQTLQAKQ